MLCKLKERGYVLSLLSTIYIRYLRCREYCMHSVIDRYEPIKYILFSR